MGERRTPISVFHVWEYQTKDPQHGNIVRYLHLERAKHKVRKLENGLFLAVQRAIEGGYSRGIRNSIVSILEVHDDV